MSLDTNGQSVTIGFGFGGTGTSLTKLGAGTLTINGGNTYTGVTNLTAGTVIVDNPAALGSGGTISFSGGTLQYGDQSHHDSEYNSADYSARFSTAANQSYRIDTGTHTITYVGALTSSGGSLTKAGAGTLTLTGANTYTGGTTVNGGTLLIDGANSGNAAVTVQNSGSLFGGTGTVSGAVTVNGGAGVLGGNGTAATGTLTLQGALTLNSGSFIELALGANGAHSTLARSGSGTWSFAANQAFTFVDAGAQTGLYDNVITGLSADPGGESSWTITGTQFRGSFAYDGMGDIDLTLTAVLESATWAGGGLTLVAAALALRRRLRRA